MAYVIGFSLAIGVAAFARIAGLDRDRAFYPTVLLVVASYYMLFGVLGGDMHALMLESIGLIAFASAAVFGVRRHLAFVAIGLAAHGVFDAAHGSLIANPGVPEWWPAFCGTYDIVAAACMIYLRPASLVMTSRGLAAS